MYIIHTRIYEWAFKATNFCVVCTAINDERLNPDKQQLAERYYHHFKLQINLPEQHFSSALLINVHYNRV